MDIYRIGITVDMVNNASQALGVIQRDVVGLHKSVDMLTNGFSAAKVAIAGLGTALSGGGVLGVREELARRRSLVQDQSQDLLTTRSASTARVGAGTITPALIATDEASRLAPAGNQGGVPGFFATFADRLGTQSNLAFRTEAQSLHQSELGAAVQTRSLDVTEALAAANNLPKASSVASFDANGETGGAGSQLSHLQNALKNSCIAARDWSDAFADAVLPALIKPLRTRNDNLSSTGLHDLQSDFEDQRPRERDRRLESYPDAVKSIPNDTGLQVMTQSARWLAPFERDPSLRRGETATSAHDALVRNDPSTRVKAFQETWNNLLAGLGAPLVDSGTKVMGSLTHAISNLTQSMAAHPESISIIEKTSPALAELVANISLFAVGTTAGTALGSLTGSAGLVGLAVGVERLGKALPSLPSWLAHWTGATTGTAVDPGATGIRTAGIGRADKIALPNPVNGLNARASLASDGTSGVWMPVGGSAVPPSTSNAAPSGPIPVYVVNGRDIADGTSAHQAAQISAPPNGPTGSDPRMTLPMPAFGTIVGM